MQNKRIGFIPFAAMLGYIVILITPYLSRNAPKPLVFALMGIMAFGFFLKPEHGHINIKIRHLYPLLWTLVFSGVMIAYLLFHISSADFGFAYATIKFLFLLCLMDSAIECLSRKQQRILLLVTVVTFLANMVSNYLIYSNMRPSAYVVYYLSRIGERTNAADTAFSSAIIFVIASFTLLLQHSRRMPEKVLAVVVLILSFFFQIVVAQRGTAFFLSLMLVLVLMMTQRSSRAQLALLLLAMAFVLWLWLGGLKWILSLLLEWMSGQRIAIKLRYLINMLESGSILEAGGSLTDRYQLVMTSINTWLGSFKNFLVGAGDHRATNLIIGNHSEIADTLGRYGLIGGVLMLMIFKAIYDYLDGAGSALSDYRIRQQIRIVFLFFLLRGVMGAIYIGSIGAALLVILPMMVRYIEQEQTT